MKTNLISSLRQYAKVSRTFPKFMGNGTNARIRASVITPGMEFKTIEKEF